MIIQCSMTSTINHGQASALRVRMEAAHGDTRERGINMSSVDMGDCDGKRFGGVSEVETVQDGRNVESEGSAAAEYGQGTGSS